MKVFIVRYFLEETSISNQQLFELTILISCQENASSPAVIFIAFEQY
jgi:hypothetical protein